MDITKLQVGIIAHLQWKSKLADFFYGVEELSLSDVSDHTSCDFGKLLYGSVLREFSDFDEINTLESLHKEVHDDIKALILIPLEERKSATGKQALDDFKKKCDRLVQIMERLQAQAKLK
ncbi:MAG: hypothetical protein D3922_07135 [Candidatus Electrothrix sp. AR1]|nr:hypothetical protein [Candidatus Electrothrix sp. AR1]